MKIVINNCFGGFGLSPEAVYKYAELAGINVYGYVEPKDSRNTYIKLKKEDAAKGKDDYFIIYWMLEDLGDVIGNEKLNSGKWFHDSDIKRNDPHLVKAVEKLKGRANGSHAQLKIIEIPNDVEWQVEEYDGSEHIAEVHRTWS